jgi:hypothetical protein
MGQNSATPKGAASKVGRGAKRRARGVFTRQAARTERNKERRIRREALKVQRANSKPPTTYSIMEAAEYRGKPYHVRVTKTRAKILHTYTAKGWKILPKSGNFVVIKERAA